MALQSYLYTSTTPTTAQSVSFEPGFTPTALIGFIVGATGSATTAQANLGMGWCVGTSEDTQQLALGVVAENDVSTGNSGKCQDVGYFFVLLNPADSTATNLIVSSITALGTTCTIDFTTVSSSNQYEYMMLALGGDLSGAEIINVECPSSTGDQTVDTTLGTPNTILFSSVAYTTSSNVGSAGGTAMPGIMLGWAVAGGNQGVSCSQGGGVQLTNSCIGFASSTVSTAFAANLVSVSDDSFKLDWTTVLSGEYCFALCLYGDFQAAAFSNNSPTSPGDQANSLSFSPVVSFLQTLGQAASSSAQAAYSQSIGYYDGTNSLSYSMLYNAPPKDGDSTAYSVYSSSNCLYGYTTETETEDETASLVASGVDLSSEVKLDFTTVYTSALQYLGLALGSAAVTAPSAPTGLAVTNDATNPTTVLDLSWNASSGATSYNVLQASTLAGTYSQVASGISGTSTTITGLTPGTEYAFEVEAVNSGGTSSPSSAVAWATEMASAINAGSLSATSIPLTPSFPNPAGSTISFANFLLRYETPVGAGNWSSVSFGGGSYTLTGLSPLTQYGIEVAVVIESNNGDWSGTIQGPWSSELTVITPPFGSAVMAINNAVMRAATW